MHPTGLAAYRPAEIAVLVQEAGVAKTRLSTTSLITLSVLAGVFIGLGAAAYTMTMTGIDPAYGPNRILGGVVFSLGLVLVVVGGAELFTGNALMVMAAVDRKIMIRDLLRCWTVVYFGNLAGALGLAGAIHLTGILAGPMGETAATIAEAKLALPWLHSFMRGVLCNVLVCLAIWLALGAKSVGGKILAIIFPISAFVALGFEHSVANMYLVPQGALAGSPIRLSAALTNLAWVTLGNILGGAGGVALAYRLAYGKSGTS